MRVISIGYWVAHAPQNLTFLRRSDAPELTTGMSLRPIVGSDTVQPKRKRRKFKEPLSSCLSLIDKLSNHLDYLTYARLRVQADCHFRSFSIENTQPLRRFLLNSAIPA